MRATARRALYGGVGCPRCRKPLRHELVRTGLQSCPSCGGSFEAVRFEPVEPVVVIPDLAAMSPEERAPCARHERNQAEAACSRCGQFMCSLCRIDAEGKFFCPPCFERLSAEGSLATTRLWNWAGISAACILASWLLWFTFIIPAFGWIAGIVFAVLGLKDKRARNETDGLVGLYLLIFFNVVVGVGAILLVLGIFGAFR